MSEVCNFERQLKKDGSKNPKYVDLLEEDKAISGQKFVCVSFISPENILKEKNIYFFKEFLKHYDFTKSLEKFSQFLNFISFKYNLEFDNVMEDLKEYTKSEKDKFSYDNISDSYKNFMDKHEEKLEDIYNKENMFQTSTRGLKVRGSYSTQEEAELRCKLLREVDPNHNVYVGPIGMWMPWEPDAYKTGRVEYLEEELNQLMKEKHKNEDFAKKQFEERIIEKKKIAIAENIKIAKKTGNKLTQNVDADGNLFGMNNTIEDNLNAKSELRVEDIRKELFDGGLLNKDKFSAEKYYKEVKK